jgi:hypothetical protein
VYMIVYGALIIFLIYIKLVVISSFLNVCQFCQTFQNQISISLLLSLFLQVVKLDFLIFLNVYK